MKSSHSSPFLIGNYNKPPRRPIVSIYSKHEPIKNYSLLKSKSKPKFFQKPPRSSKINKIKSVKSLQISLEKSLNQADQKINNKNCKKLKLIFNHKNNSFQEKKLNYNSVQRESE